MPRRVVVKRRVVVRRVRTVPTAAWGPVSDFMYWTRFWDPRCWTRGMGRPRPRRAQYRKFLWGQFNEVFGTSPPPGAHLELVKSAIGYEKQYRGFQSQGCADLLSARFLQCWRASRTLRLDAYPADAQELIRWTSRIPFPDSEEPETEGVAAMATTASVAKPTPGKRTIVRRVAVKKVGAQPAGRRGPTPRRVGRTWGLSERRTLLRMFAENETRKQTDAQLIAFFAKEFPSRAKFMSARRLRGCRRWYNVGKFTGGKAPVQKSNAYDASKKPIADPYVKSWAVRPGASPKAQPTAARVVKRK